MTVLLSASSLIDGIYAFDLTGWGHLLQTHPAPADWMVVAQYFDTDVFAGARAWWNDFVTSGKIWTLIFGIVLGYVLRALTSYG